MDVKEMVESVLVDDPVKVVAKKDENRLEVISNDDDIKTDYNYARENYYNLMEKGYDALDELLEIAKSSEHARHFEVASQLIKNLGDTNEKLLKLQETKKALVREQPKVGPNNVSNNLFVGSTSELLKMLKNNKQGETEE
jgi:predicted house-cleaning noncanonical NTP pyrophosphatase (MazG superfamily)